MFAEGDVAADGSAEVEVAGPVVRVRLREDVVPSMEPVMSISAPAPVPGVMVMGVVATMTFPVKVMVVALVVMFACEVS